MTAPGTYWAEVVNSCNSFRDSITVIQRYFPPFDLGRDTMLCDNASLLLSVSIDSANFQWTTGSTDSFVLITQQPSNPVGLTVSRNGCVVADTIHIAYEETPKPFSIGADTFYCATRYIQLSAPQTAHWSTGEAADSIHASTAGVYWAEIANFCGSYRDSANIRQEELPSGFEVVSDKNVICVSEPDSAFVSASVDSSKNGNIIFKWPFFSDTGYISSHIIYQPDTFLVIADNGKCAVAKSVELKLKYCGVECLEKFALPDALSANSDGLNDTFNIIPLCDIDPFLMQIFDRWGELVFETHNVSEGWNGSMRQKEQEQEIFMYYICFGVANVKEQKCLAGTVRLMK